MLARPHSGFHVHDDVWVPADDRPFAVRLARYCARHPVALGGLGYPSPGDTVTYQSDTGAAPRPAPAARALRLDGPLTRGVLCEGRLKFLCGTPPRRFVKPSPPGSKLKPKRGDHSVLPVCGCGRSLRARVLLLVCCGGVYATIFILTGGLRFPIEKDELHFWSTSLSFSLRIVPTLEQLRGYRELNTPLPFLLFGWAEYAFHGGIQVGRSINFLLSFAIAGIVCFGSNKTSKRSVGSLLGLLLFPYFLGVSTHLYTDVIAVFFVLLGVVFYKKGKHALSALCFALAVSSRQYMVAFPAAIFVHEVSNQAKTEPSLRMAWIAPLLASLSLLV
ncbi:MAG: hypothetical protein AABZ35_05925, partial [Gemmatimonadota bacterium]